MTPKGYMLLGAIIAGTIAAANIVADLTGPFLVLMFGGGALFGKGYGIWEERNRRE